MNASMLSKKPRQAHFPEDNMMLSTLERSSVASRYRATSSANRQQISAIAFSTALDWMALAWQDEMLRGVAFGYPSQRQAKLALGRGLYQPGQFWRFPTASQLADVPQWVADLTVGLQRFAEGEPVEFCNVPLSLDHLSGFGRRVVAACRMVTWGRTTTYGELASACGSPAAARAVGSVMARNRFPLIVPCHRVLASGGALGGYSAPDGLAMKRRLLEMEGASTPCRINQR
jgi:methylated-DNA-[protein]-cysteine S-methyltransferase